MHLTQCVLKMLGQYLKYTLIICHKSCNVKYTKQITLQKELQNVLTNNVLLEKKSNHSTNKTIKQKPLPEQEIEPGSYKYCLTLTLPLFPLTLNRHRILQVIDCHTTVHVWFVGMHRSANFQAPPNGVDFYATAIRRMVEGH